MSGHRKGSRNHGSSHGRSHDRYGDYRPPVDFQDRSEPDRYYADQRLGRYDERPYALRRRGPAVLFALLAAIAAWSLVAWVGYVAVDPVLRWIAGSAGLLVDSGKALAAVAGVGKEVGAIADSINATGLLGQTLALLQTILKPIIVIGWALGAIAIIAAPFVLRRMGGLRALRHR